MNHLALGAPMRLLLVLLLLLFVGPVACGGSSSSDGDPVDVPPTVTISEPADGAEYLQGDLVMFRGAASDFEDGPIDPETLRWVSSIDRELGFGGILDLTTLSYGVHVIELSAVDSLGQEGLDSITITVLPPLKGIAVGDLVVSEVMVTPSMVDDADGEWFEIYNPTESRIELGGLVFRDLGTDSFLFSGTFELWPHESYVFGPNRDTEANGGLEVDYAYPYGTQFQLDDVDDIVIQSGVTIIDSVVYDATWPQQVGEAMGLSEDAYDVVSNDTSTHWCVPLALYGLGDRGTPGVANPICP